MQGISPDTLWLKLDHAFFGVPRDIYLCAAYLSPVSTSYAQSIDNFTDLTSEIDRYASMGNIAVIGDLNARVGVKQETVLTLNDLTEMPIPGLVENVELPKRNSEDKSINSRGRKLLQLATNYDLFLANGRHCGDLTGKYTCCQWNGNSVVDLFLGQYDVMSRINYFKVGAFDWFSDHAPISVDIAVDIAKYVEPPVQWKKIVKQLQCWDEDTKAKMKETLDSAPLASQLENFCNTKYTSSTKAADSLAYILQEAVKKVFPRRINKRKAGPRLNPSLTYSHEVQIAKRVYRKVKRKYDKDHNSIDRRQNYIIEKKKYRKVIYRAKKVAQELKLNRLADLENSDPKRFWADVNRILRPQDDSMSHIEPAKWLNHFKTLLRPPVANYRNTQFKEYVNASLPTLEGSAVPNRESNKSLDAVELKESVKNLKSRKSTFLDEISNELIKCTFDTLCKPILYLFNTILELGDFPSCWSEGLIIPIHKKNIKLYGEIVH